MSRSGPIPKDLQDIGEVYMPVWKQRWIPRGSPFSTGFQEGTIDQNGTYNVGPDSPPSSPSLRRMRSSKSHKHPSVTHARHARARDKKRERPGTVERGTALEHNPSPPPPPHRRIPTVNRNRPHTHTPIDPQHHDVLQFPPQTQTQPQYPCSYPYPYPSPFTNPPAAPTPSLNSYQNHSAAANFNAVPVPTSTPTCPPNNGGTYVPSQYYAPPNGEYDYRLLDNYTGEDVGWDESLFDEIMMESNNSFPPPPPSSLGGVDQYQFGGQIATQQGGYVVDPGPQPVYHPVPMGSGGAGGGYQQGPFVWN